MDETDYPTETKFGNQYMIGATRNTVLIGQPVMGYMTPLQALTLAAWLVAVAEPMSVVKFDGILKQVQNS